MFRKEAGIARRIGGSQIEHRNLSVESHRRTGDQRLAQLHAGPVDRVPGGEVVTPVDDDIGLCGKRSKPLFVHALRERDHPHFGVDCCERGAGRFDLFNPD